MYNVWALRPLESIVDEISIAFSMVADACAADMSRHSDSAHLIITENSFNRAIQNFLTFSQVC